ncbi:TreTu family toxin [Enterobacter sichuanensis]
MQNSTGTTYVACPANIDAFGKQDKNGAIYVEFDVPEKNICNNQ